MDWVTSLPPTGEKGYNSSLVIVDRYREALIFLPFHNYEAAMDTALLLWNRVISYIGIFKNIIGYRDLKLTSALWNNLNSFFGSKLSFSKAYHCQTHGLEEIMIQALEDMIRRFCSY
ncbi:hypothetical protein O181_009188 [Austropuccinia psidii MF-1]|uniref:Integrase catalytic domain-containing protein n=1 Tax=Austropuccinia psidii MF-1 TaxID=1389203 RepID=A0A9Q3BQL6_9BASI|nr:hypothetical protein [Austropuccinia psidii MF-1]